MNLGGVDVQNASDAFYSKNAKRYSEVVHEYIQSVYSHISHPGLTGDPAVRERMKELIPPQSSGIDAGCGAGARDVFLYWQDGYDIWGFDAVPENIQIAKDIHPEIADKLWVGDLSKPIKYPDGQFDFVTCNAVIQHIPSELVKSTTIPELTRVLKHGGILQLMFKVGEGIKEVYDKDYDADRSFQLYSATDIVQLLSELSMTIIEENNGKLGGVMYFTDTKPVEHCLIYAQKTG